MEDGSGSNPFVVDDDDVLSGAEKIALIQQMYQEKQEALYASFERAQQSLTMQHLQQYYQTLQQQQEKMDTSTGSTTSLTGAGGAGPSSVPHTPTTSNANHATPPVHRSRRLCSDMRSLSGSSQTISQHTRDRLKSMIASRRSGAGDLGSDASLHSSGQSATPPAAQGQNNNAQVAAPSPHFEPYPVPAHHQQQPQLTGEYALRKVNSEPNMKMKIRARLLSKGSSPVHSATSAFNFHQSQLQRTDSDASTSGMPVLTPPVIFPPSLLVPSPSLPNLLPGTTLPMDLATLLSHASSLTPFLSLPSLLKTQLAMGSSMMDEGGVDRDKLNPGTAAGLPIGGYPSLLKQQLRELVLRRKSLVREEPEDDDPHCLGSFLHATSTPVNSALDGAKTGLAYDSAMARHECVCGDNREHVEHGGRVHSIWARLTEKGLTTRCERIPSKKASLEMLRSVHGSTYVTFFAVSPTACLKMETSQLPLKSFVQLACGGIGVDSDTYFNDASTQLAARVAAGTLVELACMVVEGKLRNGFACIRPPGHHAEKEQAMGFCFFNNVAIAARVLQQRYPKECARIAIIDWDVHHGNGTQPVFDQDPSVLYLSLHRHDNGNFFPGTGAVTDVGEGPGKGFSVNVAFSGGVMRDADYLAAWRVIVVPILDHFNPTFILVSAGFDAAVGHAHALGGYEISAQMFGFMTRQLMGYADGKVVLALEGGYDLTSISNAAEECVRVLSSQGGEEAGVLSADALESLPSVAAQETIQKVIAIHKRHWPTLTARQGINTSEQQWQSVSSQFQNMSVRS